MSAFDLFLLHICFVQRIGKLIQRLDRINELVEILLVVFRLKFFTQEKLEIFIHIHVYLIDQPRDKLVGIVMLIVIEKRISCADPSYKSAVVNDAPIAFGLVNVLKELI